MNSSSLPARWRADLALGSIAFIWGATFVLVKAALDDVSPLLFLALRFSLATAALALLFRTPLNVLVRPHELRGGLLAGLCLATGYVFQTWGLMLTTPSKSAFITGLYIVLVPLLGAVVYQKAPVTAEVLGVGLATAGMALLSLEGDSLRVGRGELLTLACAVAFAGHILVLGHYTQPGSYEALSLLQVATAAGVAGGTFWWAEVPSIRWSGAVLAAIGVTGILATALAFAVQTWAQQYTTPTRTALIFTLEPVFAWMVSAAVIGERLSGRAAAGAALILGGIVLAELKPSRRGKHLANEPKSG
jgi:drug/metabolite transporter (DMT)-like permease